jgi:hypothetical protein
VDERLCQGDRAAWSTDIPVRAMRSAVCGMLGATLFFSALASKLVAYRVPTFAANAALHRATIVTKTTPATCASGCYSYVLPIAHKTCGCHRIPMQYISHHWPFCTQAESTKRPRDVYEFLSGRSIGVSLALLYESWAACAENGGDDELVRRVLRLGIER